MKRRIGIVAFVLIIIVFFSKPFLIEGKFPIPADTIVGLYHPFRDLYAKEYPRGIPFKNFLVTDPVRQAYPWRFLSISAFKRFSLPLWNPYVMAGVPLLGNFQSASLYPLNLLFGIISFQYAWSIMVLLQPLLAGLFFYFYLKSLRLHFFSSVFGGIVFSFCGFNMAWLEWNTVGHTGLWLPLILLSIDKIFINSVAKKLNSKDKNSQLKAEGSLAQKLQLIIKSYVWSGILLFSLISSFFAGHLQTFFYVFLFQFIYFLLRWMQYGRSRTIFLKFTIYYLLFIIFTFIQWYPTLQLIGLSARNIDLNWQKAGWFLPWRHLVQFIAPDFFGNPTTLNYWGIWNYGEFIGYIGVAPFVFALYALLFRFDRKTVFFGSIVFIALSFSLPTPLAKLPFQLNIPFLSTAQPTRLLFLTNFSLAALAALGMDYALKNKNKIIYPILLSGVFYALGWLFVLLIGKSFHIPLEHLDVAKRNLYLPTLLFFVCGLLLTAKRWLPQRYTLFIFSLILVLTVFDLVRFSNKFLPFTDKKYLYPSTKLIRFLQQQTGQFRIMTTDPRILPPNFSIMYRLQTVDGYDPLYIRRYGELIAASERGEANIKPPLGFNRIITPHQFESPIMDLLGVKYVLSLSDISSAKLIKVFQEGETRVYENKVVYPRGFFVDKVIVDSGKQKLVQLLFTHAYELNTLAIVESKKENFSHLEWKRGNVEIMDYQENIVTLRTSNAGAGFLVLTDTYYPTWHATVDGREVEIYKTNYTFRGIIVPAGTHEIKFFDSLF